MIIFSLLVCIYIKTSAEMWYLLCTISILLQSSRGTTNQPWRRAAYPSNADTYSTNHAIATSFHQLRIARSIVSPTSSTGTACQKTFVNITVDPPRAGCSPGVLVSVPTCSGACNSYVHFFQANPYKDSRCSCCKPTTYRYSKRTVTFRCGGATDSVAYYIAAVTNCDCSGCASLPLLSDN